MDLRGAGAGMQGCHKSTIVPLWLGRETAAPTQPLRLLSAGLAGDVKLHPVFNQACEGVPSLLACTGFAGDGLGGWRSETGFNGYHLNCIGAARQIQGRRPLLRSSDHCMPLAPSPAAARSRSSDRLALHGCGFCERR